MSIALLITDLLPDLVPSSVHETIFAPYTVIKAECTSHSRQLTGTLVKAHYQGYDPRFILDRLLSGLVRLGFYSRIDAETYVRSGGLTPDFALSFRYRGYIIDITLCGVSDDSTEMSVRTFAIANLMAISKSK